MNKDIDKTLHKMNALTAITSKDIPKEIKDKIILKTYTINEFKFYTKNII